MKKFFALFAMCALAMVACEEPAPEPTPEPAPDPAKDPVLNVEVTSLEADYAGEELTIPYTIENPAEGVSLAADCEADWVENVSVGNAAVTFTVLPNEVEEVRSTTVVLTYGSLTKSVAVEQAAHPAEQPQPEPDVEFTAAYLNGTYYGNAYTTGYNYYIMLSDVGLPNENQVYLNSRNYFIDLYSATAVGSGPEVVAQGVYEFDETSSGAAGTIGAEYTYLIVANDSEIESMTICTAGTVTVTENRIEAVLTLSNGEVHRVVYEGSLELGFPEVEEEPVSTLTGDVNVNVTAGLVMGENYGDEYGIGADIALLYLYESVDWDTEEVSGHIFTLEMLLNETGFAGEYIAFEESASSYAGTFFPGEYEVEDGELYPYSCWYMYIDATTGEMTEMAPIIDGKITVVDGGDGTMSVTFDVVDDLDNKIQGTFAGEASISGPETASVKRASVALKGAKTRNITVAR